MSYSDYCDTGSGSPSSKFKGTKIEAHRTPIDREHFARFSISDVYDSHTGVRANVSFRSVDEVRQTIEALKGVLPLVERLGVIADE